MSKAQSVRKATSNFIKRNRFDVEDVQWQKNGQVTHGPYDIPDGDEEGENVPYALAVNQGRSIAGIGGWLPTPLLKRLQKNLECALSKNQCAKRFVAVCACLCHGSNQTGFVKELRYLAQHSNEGI